MAALSGPQLAEAIAVLMTTWIPPGSPGDVTRCGVQLVGNVITFPDNAVNQAHGTALTSSVANGVITLQLADWNGG